MRIEITPDSSAPPHKAAAGDRLKSTKSGVAQSSCYTHIVPSTGCQISTGTRQLGDTTFDELSLFFAPTSAVHVNLIQRIIDAAACIPR